MKDPLHFEPVDFVKRDLLLRYSFDQFVEKINNQNDGPLLLTVYVRFEDLRRVFLERVEVQERDVAFIRSEQPVERRRQG